MKAYNRLTNEDRHFWIFDLGVRHKEWRPLAIALESGDDENRGCSLIFRAFGWSLRARIPTVIKPYREWVDTSKYEWSKNPKGGYWDIYRRSYGFSWSEKSLHIHYGAQTHDSSTDKVKVFFLPWLHWRHIRRSFYDDAGNHFYTEWDQPRGFKLRDNWMVSHQIGDLCPSVSFLFKDYDGAEITATTRIEEREWRFGEGFFKWLSLFRKPKIRRSLDLKFSAEVGPEKGSWKGGTIGHSIDMLPGEMHEAAFRRYCAEQQCSKHKIFKIQFLGPVPAPGEGVAA